MRFEFIAAEKAHHSLSRLCRCLRVTRSGFYAWRGRPESARRRRDRHLKVLVRASFDASKQRYGSPRIHEDLLEQAERVSRTRVIRLMPEEDLKARVRKRYRCTTMSDHDQPVAANRLNRQFTAEAPNQRWVGDTTEFVIGTNGKLYLAAILDLFSRVVVGWAVSAINDRPLTIKALEMALTRRGPAIGLLHHSDQGCTYASADYQPFALKVVHVGDVDVPAFPGDFIDADVGQVLEIPMRRAIGDRLLDRRGHRPPRAPEQPSDLLPRQGAGPRRERDHQRMGQLLVPTDPGHRLDMHAIAPRTPQAPRRIAQRHRDPPQRHMAKAPCRPGIAVRAPRPTLAAPGQETPIWDQLGHQSARVSRHRHEPETLAIPPSP